MKQNQFGRSMIEMLGVLAIIGVLSVGGLAGFAKAMAKYRVNKTIDQITMVSHNIINLFGSQRNYKDLTQNNHFNIIQKTNSAPKEMLADGHLEDLWGGYIYVIGWKNGFFYTFVDGAFIPDNICIELLTHDWSDAGVSFINVYNSPKDFLSVPPISVANATTMCTNHQAIHFWFNVSLQEMITDYEEYNDPYVILQ